VRPAGVIPLTGHDVPVEFIVTPERIVDCREAHGLRVPAGIRWDDLTEERSPPYRCWPRGMPGRRDGTQRPAAPRDEWHYPPHG
jgi:hypothetical protein